MEIEDELIRKKRIRDIAIQNMGTKKNTVYYSPNSLIKPVYERIAQLLWTMEQNSKIVIHVPMRFTSNKENWKKVIKKSLRKVAEKVMGWYYLPVIDQQNILNDTSLELFKTLEAIIEAQAKEIEDLKKRVDSL